MTCGDCARTRTALLSQRAGSATKETSAGIKELFRWSLQTAAKPSAIRFRTLLAREPGGKGRNVFTTLSNAVNGTSQPFHADNPPRKTAPTADAYFDALAYNSGCSRSMKKFYEKHIQRIRRDPFERGYLALTQNDTARYSRTPMPSAFILR